MKFVVTVKRTIRDYSRRHIEANSEKEARRMAVKQAKKSDDDGDDEFCDGDEPKYSVHFTETLPFQHIPSPAGSH